MHFLLILFALLFFHYSFYFVEGNRMKSLLNSLNEEKKLKLFENLANLGNLSIIICVFIFCLVQQSDEQAMTYDLQNNKFNDTIGTNNK